MSSDLQNISPACTIDQRDLYQNVNNLKKIRNEFEELTLIDTAMFFTDKLITLASDAKEEVYQMAKLLHEKEEFHRAAHYIMSRDYHLQNISCRHLAAKCFFDCKEFSKSLELLELPLDETIVFDEKNGTLDQWKSSIELLKGYCYEAIENRPTAMKCFLEALQLDIFCYEALQALIKFDMITKEQESHLLSILTLDESKSKENVANFIKKIYLTEIKKDFSTFERCKDKTILQEVLPLSADMRVVEAEQFYNDFQFKKCYEIVSNIHRRDQFNSKNIMLMISCMLELNNRIGLQELSHRLVEVYPESALSWYAAGCYYYLTSNAENARKYFSKSMTMDNSFQPSMLMYGHSFELEAFHDQAISVYLNLSNEMPKSFLPLLYIGIEYSHLGNALIAERYLNDALKMSNNDLFALHELGVVAFQRRDYEMAKSHFIDVLTKLTSKHSITSLPEKWEPLLNNLGHVCRKLAEYEESVKYHKLAICIKPNCASTFSALGLVHILMEQLDTACDYFDNALSLKRDDAFAQTMYNSVFDHMLNTGVNGSGGEESDDSKME